MTHFCPTLASSDLKHLGDVRFPRRVLVGDRDLAVDRARVAVLVGDRLVDGDPLGQRDLRGVAHRDLAVAGEAQGAGIEVRAQRTVEARSEEHTSELQSLMRISYAVSCLTKKNNITR